jgi:hypothetical protein
MQHSSTAAPPSPVDNDSRSGFIIYSGAAVHATSCAGLLSGNKPLADRTGLNVIDSGAAVHTTSCAGQLSGTRPPADGASFIIDSGAAVHATGCAGLLSGTRPAADGTRWFRTRVGKDLAVTYVGSIDTPRFAVPDVHLVPGLGHDGPAALISVRQLARRGLAVTFGGDYCSVKERSTGAVVGEGRLREDDGFYYLDYLRVPRS